MDRSLSESVRPPTPLAERTPLCVSHLFVFVLSADCSVIVLFVSCPPPSPHPFNPFSVRVPVAQVGAHRERVRCFGFVRERVCVCVCVRVCLWSCFCCCCAASKRCVGSHCLSSSSALLTHLRDLRDVKLEYDAHTHTHAHMYAHAARTRRGHHRMHHHRHRHQHRAHSEAPIIRVMLCVGFGIVIRGSR